MKKIYQVKDEKQLAGKTILRFEDSQGFDDGTIIFFTDDTFCLITTDQDTNQVFLETDDYEIKASDTNRIAVFLKHTFRPRVPGN